LLPGSLGSGASLGLSPSCPSDSSEIEIYLICLPFIKGFSAIDDYPFLVLGKVCCEAFDVPLVDTVSFSDALVPRVE